MNEIINILRANYQFFITKSIAKKFLYKIFGEKIFKIHEERGNIIWSLYSLFFQNLLCNANYRQVVIILGQYVGVLLHKSTPSKKSFKWSVRHDSPNKDILTKLDMFKYLTTSNIFYSNSTFIIKISQIGFK